MSKEIFIRPITRVLADETVLTPAQIERISGGDGQNEAPQDPPVTWTYTKLPDGTMIRSDY